MAVLEEVSYLFRKYFLLVTLLSFFVCEQGQLLAAHSQSTHKSKEAQKGRILFLIEALGTGGTERALVSMLNLLSYPENQIDVCVYQKNGEFQKLIHKKVRFVSLLEASKNQYQTVVCYQTSADPDMWIPLIQAKRRIQWVHTDLSTGWRPRILDPKKTAAIDWYVCVSEKAKEGFVALRPDAAQKTIVINNLMDNREIKEESKQSITDVPAHSDVTVLTVSRLSGEKGIDRAIRVHSRLEKEGIHFHWYIIGGGCEEAKLKNQIAEQGLQGRFVLMGIRLNPYPYYKKADLFVLPSFWEGKSVVISEAQILGRPILATNVGGIREQVTSKYNGLIVESTDDAIYTGLKFLIQHSEERKKYARNLKKFKYDNSESISKLNKLFEGK